MPQVNIHEAKTHLSKLVDRAAAGEDIVIAKNGKALVRLTALTRTSKPRRPGSLQGRIKIRPDFDAPLPDDVAAEFGIEN